METTVSVMGGDGNGVSEGMQMRDTKVEGTRTYGR